MIVCLCVKEILCSQGWQHTSHLENPKLPLDTSNCRQIASVGLWARREVATALYTELDCIGPKPSVRLCSENCERKK